MANVLLSMFTLWLAVKGSASFNTLESTPPSVDGVLTACAGRQISLTCSQDTNVDVGRTFWEASPPVSCTSSVDHGSGTASDCEPFIFEEITRVGFGIPSPPALNSTAVANATVSMTDATIECIGGTFAAPVSIGNITLCIAAPPTNIKCQNSSSGLRVSWEAVVGISCARSDVNYSVTLTRESDMMSLSSLVPVAENRADLANTVGLDPSARYLITVSVDITGDTCMGQQVNVTCDTPPSTSPAEPPSSTPTTPVSTTVASTQNTSTPPPSTTSQSTPRGLSTGVIAAIAVVAIVLVFLVIVIVIVVVIILMMSSKGKKNGRGGVHASLATDPEHDSLSGQQQAPVYVMVDKSKKTASAEQPTYQNTTQ